MAQQIELFAAHVPKGFVYKPDLITPDEEQELVSQLQQLPFHPFHYRGFTAKRNVIEYGYEYDYSAQKTGAAAPIPGFLDWLKQRTAAFASINANELVECVLHEYPRGAPIGWHRDVPQFEIVVGVSLLSACTMRFRPYRREGKILSIELELRSAYMMRGEARWKWQHSIPPVEGLRYSITFRTLRQRKAEAAA